MDKGGGLLNGRIVVAGALARRPGIPGHAWVYLQYLLGLTELGFDVLFVDHLEASAVTDREGEPCPLEASWQAAWLAEVMDQVGLGGAWSLWSDGSTLGRPRAEVEAALRSCHLLVDVMGYLQPELAALAPRSLFVDIDPGFGQLWQVEGLAQLFGRHDVYATVGTNLGGPGCEVPTLGIDWIATLPPVVLSRWPQREVTAASPFTTVATWRGPFGPITHRGRTYGLRVHEFRAYADLPRRSGLPFWALLAIDPEDGADADRLAAGGWALGDPAVACGDLAGYERTIHGSAGEVLIAKQLYVAARTGWVSDRSACFLASGRPVLMSDTTLPDSLRGRDGLALFSSPEEAVEAAQRLAAEPARHQAGARRLAEELFAAEVVLPALLRAAGVP